MKNIIILISLFLFSGGVYSQSNINADCSQSIPLCTTPNFTFNATSGVGNVNDIPSGSNISNPTTNPASANSGCLLSGELKPQWLLITIANVGNLEFVFGAGNSANPQAGYYDWAMWPYSPSACNNIANNTLPPIRCNWNATSSGGTGIASAANIPAGGNQGNFEPPLAVNGCQQFIICISNYSGVNTLVSFQSLGSASLTCSPNCNPNYTVCAGSSVTVVPVNFANLTNPTYSLNPGGLTSSTGSFVVSPFTTTTYTTYITGLNNLNVVQTITATSNVTVNAQPSSVPTTTQTTCTSTLNAFNLGLSFSPSSPVPSYTVNWSPIPNGVTSSSQTSASGGIAPGQYNALIVAAGGCTTTASFSINPIPAPVSFNLSPSGNAFTVTCAQPTVAITANPASNNYTWTNGVSTPQTGQTGLFTSLNQGTWTATGVNPLSGCSDTQTFVITQDIAAPTSTLLGNLNQNITCDVNSIQTLTSTALSPTANISHLWVSPTGGTITAQSLTSIFLPGGTGTFTHYIVNNVNGCSTYSTFVITSLNGFPTYSVTSPQQFTLGCGTTSVATINIVNAQSTPAGAPLSYTLLGPPTSSIYTPGSSSTYTVNVPGTWTVITKDNSNSCETRVEISVIQNTITPQLTANVIPTRTLTCNERKTILQGISSSPNVSYSWAFPWAPGQVPNDTITAFTGTNTTNTIVATYTLSITDNSSKCKSTQTVTIYQNIAPPIATITPAGTPSLTCLTPTILLTNGSYTNPITAPFPHSQPVIGYVWSGPSPQPQQQVSSSYIAFTPGSTLTGTGYTLVAKDLNNGCTSTAYKSIIDNRIYPIVNTPVGPAPFILDCGSSGTSVYPILSGVTTGFTYSWVAVPTASFSSYTSSITMVNQPGIYKIIVTNPANGCASYGDVTVVNGSITADFSPSTFTGYAPLNVSFTNLSSSSSSVSGTSSITSVWSFGNGVSQTYSLPALPSTEYAQAGTYTVSLYVSKGNCWDTTMKVIKVDVPSKLEVPNVFTPNGDGNNDVFFLKVSNLTEISALIYDRWGNKVFESTSNSGNIEWDGKNLSDKECASGTYFYIIKATGKDGMNYEKKGNVSIYR